MDNIRLILIFTLLFILLLIYQQWQLDYGPKPVSTAPVAMNPLSANGNPVTNTANELPPSILDKSHQATATALPDVPSTQSILPRQTAITVETDVLKLEINSVGGDIRQIALPKYPVSLEEANKPFQLLNDTLPNLFVAQSGLLPADYAPSHQTVYQSTETQYHLADGEQTLNVVLTWHNAQGIQVEKIYTFTRGSYVVQVKHHVKNNSDAPWQVRQYAQFQRTQVAEAGQSSFIHTYMGGAIASPNSRYEKLTFANINDDKLNQEKRPSWANGWAAMIQHYFVSAWVPDKEQLFNYYTNVIKQGQRYVLGFYGQLETIAPKTEHEFNLQFYAGPKIQDHLGALAPGLELTVDYGWFWFISQPLFWLLSLLHSFFGNWGWAIIILTLMIKLAFFHLSATSYKSMANMRRVQPRLMSIKERYGDDRAKMNQALMDLYKKEKINPLGGCLPILVQIPVFIALYWVLLESVELRQADFILWLNDLSRPDPFFVLPLIMGATMLLQQKLNPAPIDPMQQKVMMALPLVFTVFFAFFPSGLVLYWVVNNSLSIAQQWVITKKVVGEVKLD
ncbi:membrane protein insertase YidC [Beggiatoa leptomitoformis]|nr:membrane protein insertase YidC [Beggiatoa leptomitoformis]